MQHSVLALLALRAALVPSKETFVLLLLSVTIYWIWTDRNRRKQLPPGEFGWPVIGYRKPSHETTMSLICRLRKKHGDTFTWKLGGRTYVFLCNEATMKNVFNSSEVADRPEFFSFKAITNYKITGIFNSSGELWQTTRRFTMRHLRDMGFGKSSLENNVLVEAKELVEDFKNYLDKPTIMPMSLSIANLNIIWKMLSDIRLRFDDPEMQKLQQFITDIFVELNGNVIYFDQFPILEQIVPQIAYGPIGIKEYIQKSKNLIEYVQTTIQDHKNTLDEDNPRDFIDEFLIEQKKASKTDEAFADDNLDGLIIDIFTAGGETTSITIRGIILYMAKYPEIQIKVQKELDEIVHSDRLPGMSDKPSLNYTEAVFHEVQRLISVSPCTFPRVPSKPITVDGYTFDKDVILIGHVEGLHFDPTLWKKPNEFYPEHFLDEDGKFTPRKESYYPFSLGRRVCPAESFAKLNVFLFGSALLQNFTFKPAPGETLNTDRDPNSGLFFNGINDFKIVISERK